MTSKTKFKEGIYIDLQSGPFFSAGKFKIYLLSSELKNLFRGLLCVLSWTCVHIIKSS